jgi:hypothetical protein
LAQELGAAAMLHVLLVESRPRLVEGEQAASEAVLDDPHEVVVVELGRQVDHRPKGGGAPDAVDRGDLCDVAAGTAMLSWLRRSSTGWPARSQV